MKTLEQIIKNYKSDTLDGRDLNRIALFLPNSELNKLGLSCDDEKREILPFTREKVMELLEDDLEFAFEKALNQRGLSSACMFEVIKMWNWILDEGLEDWSDDDYAMYGLPLYKATALKYGFNNPIGDDSGSESKYGE